CLRELRSLVNVVGDFNYRFPRVNDAQKNDGVHFKRHVVASDDILRRHFQRFLSQRNSYHSVDGGKYKNHPRPLCLRQQTPQPEDHTALVFGENFYRAEKIKRDDNDDDGSKSEPDVEHLGLPHLIFKDCFFRGLYRTWASRCSSPPLQGLSGKIRAIRLELR